MSEIMKIIEEWETQQEQQQKIKTEKNKGNGSYSESVRAKLFCHAFKVGFFQLIYQASLIFKSNLELALSNVLKEKEFYESKHVVLECRCLKLWDLLSVFLNPNPSLKMTSFANITRTFMFERTKIRLNVPLSPANESFLICFIESPLKMLKKCFLFYFRSSFCSQDV